MTSVKKFYILEIRSKIENYYQLKSLEISRFLTWNLKES